MSLSEQAVRYMAAAAAAYGPQVLASSAQAGTDTPEMLGRGLLRMLFGVQDPGLELPLPLADLVASPADPDRQAGLEEQADSMLDEQPGLPSAISEMLAGFYRQQAAAGDAQALVGLGDLLNWQDDVDGTRAAYHQAIDAGSDFADHLRGRLSPAAEPDHDDDDLADLPPQFHPHNFTRTGIEVLSHGLPALPEVLTYQMAIPVAYWTASQCAVVVFLTFNGLGLGGREPMLLQVTYSRTGEGWTGQRHSYGSSFGHDPIARPGYRRDLDGQPMVCGGSAYATQPPPPGHPAVIVTGRAGPRRHAHSPHPGRPRGPPPAQVTLRRLGRLHRAADTVPGSRTRPGRNRAGHPGHPAPGTAVIAPACRHADADSPSAGNAAAITSAAAGTASGPPDGIRSGKPHQCDIGVAMTTSM